MGLSVGTRVTHPARPEWGVGVVTDVREEPTVRVWFEHGGEKRLKNAPLAPATGDDLSREVILAKPVAPPKPTRRAARGMSESRSIEDYKRVFIERFPKAFSDQRYLKAERNYKVDARERLQRLLSEVRLRELLAGADYETATKDALSVIGATNLVFPNERMQLADGLKRPGATRRFCECLTEVLYGTSPIEGRIEAFWQTLEVLDAASWTIATYFQFLAAPTEHMFLKPVVSRRIADACRVELNYRPVPNWLTYCSFLQVTRRLGELIEDLEPRDNIDLQSFIWCTR